MQFDMWFITIYASFSQFMLNYCVLMRCLLAIDTWFNIIYYLIIYSILLLFITFLFINIYYQLLRTS